MEKKTKTVAQAGTELLALIEAHCATLETFYASVKRSARMRDFRTLILDPVNDGWKVMCSFEYCTDSRRMMAVAAAWMCSSKSIEPFVPLPSRSFKKMKDVAAHAAMEDAVNGIMVAWDRMKTLVRWRAYLDFDPVLGKAAEQTVRDVFLKSPR